MMSLNWYVLHVKPHKERVVHGLLEAEQVEVYYPILKVKPVNPRSRKERPFFPGYMFVRLDIGEKGRNALRWTEGTYGLVHVGGEPATVPDQLILDVKKRIQMYRDARESSRGRFKKGERVVITEGPFAGYEAIFDTYLSGTERVQVLLSYLNDRAVRLKTKVTEIEKSRPKN